MNKIKKSSGPKKFFWLKLRENFFDEKLHKYIRSLPSGDTLLIAYLKMQLKSLRTEGFIKYDQILPSSEEELAMILDEDVNTIKLLLGALEKAKAIEIMDDGSIYMLAMQELIGTEGSSAERVRNFRARQKQKMLQCNGNVTKCNTEIEIESESELDIEPEDGLIDINNYLNNIDFVQNIYSDYNELFKNLQIYFDDPSVLPTSVANQIKLYQIAVKELYDNNQLELLSRASLPIFEKVFGNIIKAKNIESYEQYYFTSLINELIKIYKEDKKDDKT